MINNKDAQELDNCLYNAMHVLDYSKNNLLDIKTAELFQTIHIYRCKTIPETLFRNEDPLYRSYGGIYNTLDAIYVCPAWTLFDKLSILRFRAYIEDYINTTRVNIEDIHTIIPNIKTGIYSPKDSKIITHNIKNISAIEIMFGNKVYNKVKNNIVSFW